jgi:HAD superfamily hydrolase (TIGR01509 family)
MPLEALIFDVDGTLADTEEGHRTAFNLAFERLHVPFSWDRETYRTLLSVTGGKERLAHHIASQPLPDPERARLLAQVPAIHAEKTRFYAAMAGDGGIVLRPGVARLVDEARRAGLPLAIASTTTRANIDALLRATWGAREGASLFRTVACGDEVPRKKPAPDIYRLALQRLGKPAGHCVAFEDSPNGLRAASAAGLFTVVTPTYWNEYGDFDRADCLWPDLDALTLDALRTRFEGR